MPDLVAIEIITDNLAEHHAVRAWSELRPKRVEPTAIETLARRRKTAIYKLHGVGPAGTAVIAKRTLTETALTEHRIYQEILPELPIGYFLRATAYDHLREYKPAAENYHRFLESATGQFPDQEWQARHRLITIEPKK